MSEKSLIKGFIKHLDKLKARYEARLAPKAQPQVSVEPEPLQELAPQQPVEIEDKPF